MLEYDVMKSPGLGAFFAGQKQADMLQNSESNRALQGAQTTNIYSRLNMDQEMHPLKLEQQRLQNTGSGLDNTKKQQDIDKQEQAKRLGQMDIFFKTMQETDDPELAFVKSGVPRSGKFAEYAQMPAEQRAKLYEQWSKARNRDATNLDSARTDNRLREIKAQTDADFRRAQMVQEEQTKRMREKIAADAANNERRLAQVKQPTIRQRLGALIEARNNVFKDANMPEQVKLIQANNIQAEIEELFRIEFHLSAAGNTVRQAGQPVLPGLPVTPPVNPNQLLNGPSVMNPANVPGAATAPPPGAVRPRN